MHQRTLPLWREILSQNFTRLDPLADFLELDASQRSCLLARPRFPLNLPHRLASKIQKSTLEDPILLQFVPLYQENAQAQGFCKDPVADQSFRTSAKLLHKYEGRILLVATGVCAMHCRYCFRQNFEYERADKSFEKELSLISQNSSINEVILSGGDPLALANETLEEMLLQIARVPHIRKVRFHTRFPMGIPERIDESFLKLIEQAPMQLYMVIHSNHPHEFDGEVLDALKRIRLRGAVLLNQSVLLRGVNDCADTLVQLSNLLVDNGILPYYLHQLDKVEGAAHFEVAECQGQKIMEEMHKRLPGYAVPKYVREVAGKPHKTYVSP